MQIEEEEEEEGAATVAEKWDDKWEPVLHNRIPGMVTSGSAKSIRTRRKNRDKKARAR
jgi:hypothetical protein